MMVEKTYGSQAKLRKLALAESRLARLGKRISVHPLLSSRSLLLGATVKLLQQQASIRSLKEKPILLSLQIVLNGIDQADSVLGLIGQDLLMTQQAAAALLAADSSKYASGARALFLSGLQMASLAIVYVTTQILGDWAKQFKGFKEADKKFGGAFYRELGLHFVLASGLLEFPFKLTRELAGLKQNREADKIGSFYLLLLCLLMIEKEQARKDEFLAGLKPYLQSSLESVEKEIKNFEDKSRLDEKMSRIFRLYLQIMKSSLEKNDFHAFFKALDNLAGELGVSLKVLKKNLEHLAEWAKQLNELLNSVTRSAAIPETEISQKA